MKNSLHNKYYIIVNPNAGKGNALKKWPQIKASLRKSGLVFKYEFTEEPGQCINIVKTRLNESYRRFLCVGGDGTLNEILNAIFVQDSVPASDIYLGLIPMGTGNDWRKYYILSDNIEEVIKRIAENNCVKQDVGELEYSQNGLRQKAYFINIAGLGFDSVVVKNTNKMKERGNRSKSAYLIALLKSLFIYKPWQLKINIGDKCLEGKFLSVSIGNGKYSGSGMIQTPDAIIDDGMFDVTVYNKIPKIRIILNVKNLYNGKILSIKGVNSYRAASLKIESDMEIFAETDGEIIGDGPYNIKIIPKALNVIV